MRYETETRAYYGGVQAAMSSVFFVFFALVLGERVLKHSDNLSKALQSPSLTAFKGHQMAQLTSQTLSGIHSQETFDSFGSIFRCFKPKKVSYVP